MKGAALLKRFSELSRRERLLVFGSALVMSVLLLDQAVLSPWWNHTTRIRREIQKLESGIKNSQRLLDRRSQVFEQAAAYQKHRRLLHEEEVDMADVLRQLESLAHDSGVQLGQMKPSAPVEEGSTKRVTVEMHCVGTLDQWVRMVYSIQTSPWMFEVERATLEAKAGDSQQLVGTFRLVKKWIVLDTSGSDSA